MENIIDIEEQYQVATYKKFPFVVERGEDVWVYTSTGERYLDLYGGHAVVSTGHSHPRIVRAISEQAARLIFYSNLVYNDTRARAARKLVDIAHPLHTKVFFCNSGTEANENAIKIARKLTGRDKVISFDGSFHGRTPGSLAATGLPKYREGISPMLAGHVYAPFDDVAAIESLIDEQAAAVILEPIQSMGGARMGSPEFYPALRELCDRAQAKLPQVAELRGLGYLVGIRFTSESARPYQQALLARKIITGLADDPSVLRLLPPLTLKRAEIDLFLSELATMQF